MKALRFLILPFLGCAPVAQATEADGLPTLELTVDGVVRTALVYVPPGKASGYLPLVFVFHGHGGTSRNAANTFRLY